MNEIEPYCADYVFPTSRPAVPSDMVHSDWEKIHADFANHPAMVRRNGVTFLVCCVCVALCVAHYLTFGFNASAFAVCCVVAFLGYVLRPAQRSAQRGTQQNYATPDQWPPTKSATPSKSVTVIIINNVVIK